MLDLLDMVQEVRRDAVSLKTTRLPMRIDGARPASGRAAPALGDANALLTQGWGPKTDG
jgi:crotonobetainyl-CoA:carnitine CoA-transferase CaiB-like acyl-CoA transferase